MHFSVSMSCFFVCLRFLCEDIVQPNGFCVCYVSANFRHLFFSDLLNFLWCVADVFACLF